jgi:hypothetical protein
MAIATTTPVPVETAPFRYLDWGPVILGALGAAAMSVVLLAFGSALGLSVVSPYPYAGISAKGAAILAAVYLALVMVASFAAGGYIAGRMRSPWRTTDETESYFRDGAHGFGVWSIGVLLTAALAASGVGAVVAAAGKATTAIVAAGTAGAASNPELGQLSLRPSDYAIDRLLAPAPAGAPADPAATATSPGGAQAPAQAPAMQARRQRADLEAPMARALAAGLTTPQLDVRDRTYLARVVSEQTGLSQADAEKRVDETFADLKAAEQKARDAAEAARKTAIIAAFLAAATLAIGCAAACAGAAMGARHRDERTAVSFLGSTRFW